jgi:hypothetical protein
LIVPITLIASTTDEFDLPPDEDERLPDAEMAKLLAEALPMLSLCVSSMRIFFQTCRRSVRRKGAARPERRRPLVIHRATGGSRRAVPMKRHFGGAG